MLPVIPMWVHFTAMFAAAGFALAAGGREARLAASVYLMTNLALFGFGSGEESSPVELELAVYGLEAAAFSALALVRRRGWLLVPCLIAWLELSTAILHGPLRLDRWTYGTVQLAWFYLNWATIAGATAVGWRKRAVTAAAT